MAQLQAMILFEIFSGRFGIAGVFEQVLSKLQLAPKGCRSQLFSPFVEVGTAGIELSRSLQVEAMIKEIVFRARNQLAQEFGSVV